MLTCVLRFSGLVAVLLTGVSLVGQDGSVRVLDEKVHHLGDTRVTTWPAGTPDPEGLELRIPFTAAKNPHEYCLVIQHYHVDDPWPIRLNGKVLDNLRKSKELRDHLYLIPEGALVDGANELHFRSKRKTDDILIGPVRIVAKTQREYLRLRPVRVSVTDGAGDPLPAKITVTDPSGDQLAPVYYPVGSRLAVRPGIVYTAGGTAVFELPEGGYRIYASRGVEWGVDERRIRIAPGAPAEHQLRISREVDTAGYVASDSHLHTLTFSGHGDASVEERMVTLAGEGIELAISTDHNHNTDYRPYQEKMELHEHFTPVVGNEVTTKNGHFNAFPLDPNDPVPEHESADWVKVVDGIRARGAKVVVLNHPRWPRVQTTSPFGKQHFHLNRLTGERARGPEFTFDAMELVNSTVKRTDPIFRFVDWFALLNHGDRIMAVGTSDSHTVGDPVGQGRTYVKSSTDVPSQIDVEEACHSYKHGHSSVSQGLFGEAFVYGKYGMGSLAPVKGERVSLSFRVASAAWARPDRARVYLNGKLVADRSITTTAGQPTNQTLLFELPRPVNDAHLVCIATGPGVQGRFWKGLKGDDFVLAATNPIFLDADGDREYSSPRQQALTLLRENGIDAEGLVPALTKVDDAVVVQTLAALLESHRRLAGDDPKRRDEAKAVIAAVADGLPGRGVAGEFLKSIQ